MDLVSRRAELLNRQVIDTDQDETALNEPASCIAGQSHKVRMELVVVPESAVRRLQEKACCLGRQCSGLEVLGGDVATLRELDDLHRADERLDRHSLDRRATVEEVARGVDVRPRVRAQRKDADVSRVTAANELDKFELRRGFACVCWHAGSQPHGHVIARHDFASYCPPIILGAGSACYRGGGGSVLVKPGDYPTATY